jgi:2',3'-cyclic-nucleotide 2'-phosphodiesterase (5'-nucleotidase family)
MKVAMIGLAADRGPQAVSTRVMEGFYLTPGEEELKQAIPLLRNEEKVDLIVLISERGLAGNLELVETIPGIDVVLSSDMHEETSQVLVAKSGTLLVEEGQDGTMLGELTVKVKNGKVASWDFKGHRINEINNKPDEKIQAIVDDIRKTFIKGADFQTFQTQKKCLLSWKVHHIIFLLMPLKVPVNQTLVSFAVFATAHT